ncbi:MAG: hypothetical protein AB7S26_27610 [Sandaracinaceae bacterium]
MVGLARSSACDRVDPVGAGLVGAVSVGAVLITFGLGCGSRTDLDVPPPPPCVPDTISAPASCERVELGEPVLLSEERLGPGPGVYVLWLAAAPHDGGAAVRYDVLDDASFDARLLSVDMDGRARGDAISLASVPAGFANTFAIPGLATGCGLAALSSLDRITRDGERTDAVCRLSQIDAFGAAHSVDIDGSPHCWDLRDEDDGFSMLVGAREPGTILDALSVARTDVEGNVRRTTAVDLRGTRAIGSMTRHRLAGGRDAFVVNTPPDAIIELVIVDPDARESGRVVLEGSRVDRSWSVSGPGGQHLAWRTEDGRMWVAPLDEAGAVGASVGLAVDSASVPPAWVGDRWLVAFADSDTQTGGVRLLDAAGVSQGELTTIADFESGGIVTTETGALLIVNEARWRESTPPSLASRVLVAYPIRCVAS